MILLLKSRVAAHTRTLANGTVVQVREHDTARQAAQPDMFGGGGGAKAPPSSGGNGLPHSPTDPQERMKMLAERGAGHVHPDSMAAHHMIGPWGPHNPHITSHKVGKHPTELGEAPEGATHVHAYNYGKGPVAVWTRRGRNGEGVYDPSHPNAKADGWNYRTEAHHVARDLHAKKYGRD